MPGRKAVVAIALGSAALLVGGHALANHAWSTYHWQRTTAQITPPVGDNVSSQWDSYLRTAVSDWNRSVYIESPVVTGQSNPRNCRPTAGRIEVCNASYGNTGWLGIARPWATVAALPPAAVLRSKRPLNGSPVAAAAIRAENRSPGSSTLRSARRLRPKKVSAAAPVAATNARLM